jgi:acyl-CoA hydrolase
MKSKNPKESFVEMTEMVLPQDTNAIGTIFGGVVMKWIDIAAAISARRYSKMTAVTASIDRLNFLSPVKLGDTVVIKAKVIYTGNTSMDIGVTVESEHTVTGERHLTAKAFLTFVALDERGKPTKVPPLRPETAEEKKNFIEAKKRRERARF